MATPTIYSAMKIATTYKEINTMAKDAEWKIRQLFSSAGDLMTKEEAKELREACRILDNIRQNTNEFAAGMEVDRMIRHEEEKE